MGKVWWCQVLKISLHSGCRVLVKVTQNAPKVFLVTPPKKYLKGKRKQTWTQADKISCLCLVAAVFLYIKYFLISFSAPIIINKEKCYIDTLPNIKKTAKF